MFTRHLPCLQEDRLLQERGLGPDEALGGPGGPLGASRIQFGAAAQTLQGRVVLAGPGEWSRFRAWPEREKLLLGPGPRPGSIESMECVSSLLALDRSSQTSPASGFCSKELCEFSLASAQTRHRFSSKKVSFCFLWPSVHCSIGLRCDQDRPQLF